MYLEGPVRIAVDVSAIRNVVQFAKNCIRLLHLTHPTILQSERRSADGGTNAGFADPKKPWKLIKQAVQTSAATVLYYALNDFSGDSFIFVFDPLGKAPTRFISSDDIWES